jgi:hypothetical protein
MTEIYDDQSKDQSVTLKKGEDKPLSSPDKSTIDGTEKQLSTEIDNPFQIVTPLQFTRGNPNAEVIFIGDLTPISIEEIPPSDFFFSKKRKVVVKKEMHQKEGTMVKKNRVLLDGQNLEDEDFATEVAESLGDFSTTNLFSVDNLKERLKQRNQMIIQLQNQIRNTEKNVREEVNKGLEQARASDKQEIQLLKSSLDEMHKNMQESERQTIQQDELIKQLQVKVSSTEKMVVDIALFQAQALEVLKKLEIAQQSLFAKVGIIQDHFQEVNQSLDNIDFREREATAAQSLSKKRSCYPLKKKYCNSQNSQIDCCRENQR